MKTSKLANEFASNLASDFLCMCRQLRSCRKRKLTYVAEEYRRERNTLLRQVRLIRSKPAARKLLRHWFQYWARINKTHFSML